MGWQPTHRPAPKLEAQRCASALPQPEPRQSSNHEVLALPQQPLALSWRFGGLTSRDHGGGGGRRHGEPWVSNINALSLV